MALTTDEFCVRYFERTVLPYLRDHCKLDAQHLEHTEGYKGAYIRLDAPKDYKDIKRYNGIGVSVDGDIHPFTKDPVIIGCIISSVDQWDNWKRKVFSWKSPAEMVFAVNLLKQTS